MGIKETLRSWWTNESSAERDERHLHAYGRGPSPWDKYLPVWVIVTMSLAVAMLLLLMKFAAPDACRLRADCAAPASMAGEPTPKERADAAAGAAASAASAAALAASR